MENTVEKLSKVNTVKKENLSSRTTGSKNPRKRKIIRLSKIKYDEKIVQVKRVTKVVKGGKKNDFSSNCYYWR